MIDGKGALAILDRRILHGRSSVVDCCDAGAQTYACAQ